MTNTIDDKNLIIMKLLHYFITEKNYNPIILQGVDNEIWLENLSSDYKIIRIVSNYIHNDEQLDYDFLKTKHVVKKIKKKTLSINMNVLNIFTDLGENVNEDLNKEKNIKSVSITDVEDLKKYDFIKETFPDIFNKMEYTEDGMQLFIKISEDINKKNKKDQTMAEDIFKKKKPIITYTIIIINVLLYLFMIMGNANAIVGLFGNYGYYVIKYNQYYRLITNIFIHSPTDPFHLIFNCYALYAVGTQLESYMGKWKFLIIYLYGGLIGSLLSMAFNMSNNVISIGASGAIFGILGSLLYFGYHYRVYLGTVIKSQIIPLILVNLALGVMEPSIDNFAHLGGLLGGIIITSAVGVKYKSSKQEIINGCIFSILLVATLIFISFKFVA